MIYQGHTTVNLPLMKMVKASTDVWLTSRKRLNSYKNVMALYENHCQERNSKVSKE